MKKIVLLGSTGSVGRNVLQIVSMFPDRYEIMALSGNKNVELLAQQVNTFSPAKAVSVDPSGYDYLKENVSSRTELLSGEGSLEELAVLPEADIIFISIAGISAMSPLAAAVKAGKTIALASKEPIVSAGELITSMAGKYGAKILPVDSEHSAIEQCMQGHDISSVETLYITGTGGSLWNRREEDLCSVSIKDVLSHPKWSMGRKITVDSATLMNKGLELIEARWLFDVDPEQIKVVIHPEAIIHSMVQFIDGTVKASLFCPDMRFPILKALAYPDIHESTLPRLDFSDMETFSFYRPERWYERAILLAREALRQGGTLPAVLNGSNEAAVNIFLQGKIKFSDILDSVEKIMKKHIIINSPSLGDIADSERWAYDEMEKKT